MVKRFLSVWLTLSLALSLFSACASTPKTVMYVGDSAISREEYNYTYNTQVRDFYDAYSSYLSYFGIDPDKPLEEQPCSFTEEGGTWADYFMDQTETILTQVYSFYNEARANVYMALRFDAGEVLTAMVTPFDEKRNIDYQAVEKLVKHLVANGSDAVIVAGTTGESPTLTHEEEYDGNGRDAAEMYG